MLFKIIHKNVIDIKDQQKSKNDLFKLPLPPLEEGSTLGPLGLLGLLEADFTCLLKANAIRFSCTLVLKDEYNFEFISAVI